jgi:Tol biopolymer transport system component
MAGVAALLAGLGGVSRSAEAAFPGANGKIAYERLDNDFEILATNLDGSGTVNLTFDPARYSDDFSPAWSPDGTKIAFHASREGAFDGGYDIYVMNADGTGQTRITTGSENDYDPAWSPDETRIAFAKCCPDGNAEIYAMNADGTGQTNLTNNASWDTSPGWSPDGTRIVFDSNRADPDADEIYLMNADGTGQTNVSNNPAQDYSPAWSPDGTRIAFVSDRDDWNKEIYVMSADGTDQSRRTIRPSADSAPAWSPDGTKIAFAGYEAGNPEILVMNTDGTGQINLTQSQAPERDPDWQPLLGALQAIVKGTVRTRVGDVIPRAKVLWRGLQRGSTVTGRDGKYRMSSANGGAYKLTTSASGCRSKSAYVTLTRGTTITLDFRLRC